MSSGSFSQEEGLLESFCQEFGLINLSYYATLRQITVISRIKKVSLHEKGLLHPVLLQSNHNLNGCNWLIAKTAISQTVHMY